MADFYHKSVLLQETIESLKVSRGDKYIDATLGGGGHTEEILRLGGVVLGIDTDLDSLLHVRERIKDSNLTTFQGNFRDIDKIAKENGFEGSMGIVMDLGVSSHQVDDWTRGFSYLKVGPLDMRMDKSQGVKASDLLNILSKGELYEIFYKFGEEPRSHAIANRVVQSRRVKAFEKTSDLTDVIEQVYGMRNANIKTRAQIYNKVFQALRIAVNDELGSLSVALPKALKVLRSGGRICVITFHSLEDRIVKQAFLDFESENLGSIITKKPIVPSFAEISENRRAKSAKLRVFQKI